MIENIFYVNEKTEGAGCHLPVPTPGVSLATTPVLDTLLVIDCAAGPTTPNQKIDC